MTGLVLASAGCVAGGEAGDSSGAEADGGNPPEAAGEEDGTATDAIASSTTTSTGDGSDLRVDLYSLERLSADRVVLHLGLHNTGSSRIDVARTLAFHGTRSSAHYVTLVDLENMRHHYPLEDIEGECYCSTWERNLAGGESAEGWVVYPAPEVDSVSVHTPVTAPFPDIPITEGTGSDLPEPEEELAEPTILDLHHLVEDLEDGTGRDESGEGVAISLAADVLFDLNESTLTGDAQAILEEVAAEIDESDASVIQIDGHTDSSGTDSINDPLSTERAESVRDELEDLVGRSGVEYETEGHGSSDPIADNDTEEGREQNRRVTVTIAS